MPTNLRHSRLGGRPTALGAAAGGGAAVATFPALTSLVSYWKLDEASGDAIDSHGTNHLTDTNTVTTAAGKVGTARQFTAASTEYFTTPSTASLQTGDIDFTFAGWMYLDSKGGTRALITKWSGVQQEYFLAYMSGTDRITFHVSSTGANAFLVEATALGSPATSTWYFVVAWHDSVANTINIQVNDGTVTSVAHSAGVFPGTAPVTMGNPTMNGRLDEVSFWKRVLTAGERTLLYGGGSGAAYTPPARRVMYYNGATFFDYDIGRALATHEQTTTFARTRTTAVLLNGAGGTWDSTFVKDPWVIYDAGTWKMWYGGYNGTAFQIGYATSADGITWTKHASNPVVTIGVGGGVWDNAVCMFPIVYKDNDAVAGKRYRMFYTGADVGGIYQIGYAYSADGVSWTKGASNPVVTPVPATWEAHSLLGGALAKDGSTYYLYYEGDATRTFPNPGSIGVVTFTDFEGAYTKSGSNPVLARRTGDQALTANLTAGTTTVTVASTAAFTAGEVVWITNATVAQQVAIASITDATHLEIATAATNAFTTAASSRIQTFLRCVFPRTVWLDGATWRMWLTGYQVGITADEAESTYYATSSDPVTGWAYSHTSSSPPFPLASYGAVGPWDSISAENPNIVFDAATGLPVTSAVY